MKRYMFSCKFRLIFTSCGLYEFSDLKFDSYKPELIFISCGLYEVDSYKPELIFPSCVLNMLVGLASS